MGEEKEFSTEEVSWYLTEDSRAELNKIPSFSAPFFRANNFETTVRITQLTPEFSSSDTHVCTLLSASPGLIVPNWILFSLNI